MRKIFSWAGALAGLLALSTQVDAASTLVVQNTDTTTSGSGICIAAPDREMGTVVVKRLRVTGSRTTATSYIFVHKRTSDRVLDTESLTTCDLPGCKVVLALEGVVAGKVFDVDNLNLVLPPGHRLYFYTGADIGADNQTVETYFDQR